MKRKFIIITIVFCALSLLAGVSWEPVERYLRIRRTPVGALKVQELGDLYMARLYDEVLKGCDRAEADFRYAEYCPHFIYIRWMTFRQLGRNNDADATQRRFMKRFPAHALAADMYFAEVRAELAVADYDSAQRKLLLIEERFPGAAISSTARELREKLQTSPISPTTRQTNAVDNGRKNRDGS